MGKRKRIDNRGRDGGSTADTLEGVKKTCEMRLRSCLGFIFEKGLLDLFMN